MGRRGFTLVEALASVILLAVGIVATQSALGALSQAQARAKTLDLYYVLARSKWDELIVTATTQTGGQEGDFADDGHPDISWTFDVEASGITDLDTVRLTVHSARGEDTDPEAVLSGLHYQQPLTSGTGGAAGATGQ